MQREGTVASTAIKLLTKLGSAPKIGQLNKSFRKISASSGVERLAASVAGGDITGREPAAEAG